MSVPIRRRSILALSLSLPSLVAALRSGPVLAQDGASPARQPRPEWQRASLWPDRIVTTLPESPQTSFAVTWRTLGSVGASVAQITPAPDGPHIEETARTVGASRELLDLEQCRIGAQIFDLAENQALGTVAYHSVVFRDLEPDMLYAYRVRGGEGLWSAWFEFRTAPAAGPLRFLYVGDAQNDLDARWSRVIRTAYADAPDARFVIHAGDLVDKSERDGEWAEWFHALGFIHTRIPALVVPGNHEFMGLVKPDARSAVFLTPLWRPQFAVPSVPELGPDLNKLVYAVRYSDELEVFVLSTTWEEQIPRQAAWLDRQLAQSTARWKVVSFHHPIFSSHKGRDTPEKRDPLLPVLLRHKVDLVLQGHDHTYARGAIGTPPSKLGFHDAGAQITTMFVNSVSGPKQYDFKDSGWDEYRETGVRLARKAEDTQFYQVISLEGDTLSYRSNTASGTLYDDFVLRKNADGSKTIVKGATAVAAERHKPA